MPVLKNYEGSKVGSCSIVLERGPNEGRRVTHAVRCIVAGKLYPRLVRSNRIQQAIQNHREICPFCPKKARDLRTIVLGKSYCGATPVERLPNGIYPGGRKHVQLLIECACPSRFVINGEEWLRAMAGERQSPFTCGRNCVNTEWPDPQGHWEVLGPASPPPEKSDAQENWWNVRCIAPVPPKGEVCGNLRVKSTSDLHKRNASQHCGCLTPSQVANRHAATRDPIRIGARKVLKDYIDPEYPSNFGISLERAILMLTSSCVYCGKAPFQKTNIEIYAGKNRRTDLGTFIHGGLDRVESEATYLTANTVPACKTCNWFKGAQDISTLYDRLIAIADRKETIQALQGIKIGVPEPSRWLADNRHRFCDTTFGYIFDHLYRAKRQAAHDQKRDFKISMRQFLILSHAPCTYCGTAPSCRVQFHVKHGPKRNCCGSSLAVLLYQGIDRFENNRGYVPGNMVPCCDDCNRSKKNLTIEAFVQHTELMLRNAQHWHERIKKWTEVPA